MARLGAAARGGLDHEGEVVALAERVVVYQIEPDYRSPRTPSCGSGAVAVWRLVVLAAFGRGHEGATV